MQRGLYTKRIAGRHRQAAVFGLYADSQVGIKVAFWNFEQQTICVNQIISVAEQGLSVGWRLRDIHFSSFDSERVSNSVAGGIGQDVFKPVSSLVAKIDRTVIRPLIYLQAISLFDKRFHIKFAVKLP